MSIVGPRVWILLVSSLLMFLLNIFSLGKGERGIAHPFSASMACASLWSLGFFFEIVCISFTDKVFWYNLQYLPMFLLPVFWFWTTLKITGVFPFFKRKHLIIFAGLSIIFFVLVATNSFHGMLLTNLGTITEDGYTFILGTPTPLFYWISIYEYSFLVISFFMVVIKVFSSKGMYVVIYLLLLSALLFPLVFNTLHLLQVIKYSFNYTPFFFLISGVIMAYSIVKLKIYNIVPIAKDLLVSNMADGLIVIDKAGYIIEFNNRACEIFSMHTNDVLGKSAEKVFPSIKEYFNSRGELDDEWNFFWKNRYYNASTRKVSRNGKVISKIFVVKDIDENIRYEKQILESRERAERINYEKGVFLQAMSERIRDNIDDIFAYLDQIMDTPLSETQIDYISKSRTSSEFLYEIINSLTDVSKIESGSIELNNQNFNPVKMLGDIKDLFMPIVRGKNLELKIQFFNHEQGSYSGDVVKIKQILVNLLNNSIKFTTEGGVYLNVIHGRLYGNMRKVVFVIKDTGIGMSSEQMERLFSPFSQADSSISRKYGGSGLGLTIAKAFIERMSGHIYVRSKIDAGSTFIFYLMVNAA